MIAYNHTITFIPPLHDGQGSENNRGKDEITIRKKPFPALSEKVSYEISFSTNQGRELRLYTDRAFSRTVKGQLWVFEVENVLVAYWNSGTKELNYIPQEKFTETLLHYWIVHIVLPLFFTIEERYHFLHAGAVEIEEKPVLFIAESFGGKSTMTDYFMQQGHTMISDDKVAILEDKKEFLAIPSHPHHRPYRKMEDLGYYVENFARSPRPIERIYRLQKMKGSVEIEIVELKGIEKFKALYASSEINMQFLKPNRLEFLSRLAREVAVYDISVPWSLDRLDEVYRMVVRHIKEIS